MLHMVGIRPMVSLETKKAIGRSYLHAYLWDLFSTIWKNTGYLIRTCYHRYCEMCFYHNQHLQCSKCRFCFSSLAFLSHICLWEVEDSCQQNSLMEVQFFFFGDCQKVSDTTWQVIVNFQVDVCDHLLILCGHCLLICIDHFYD